MSVLQFVSFGFSLFWTGGGEISPNSLSCCTTCDSWPSWIGGKLSKTSLWRILRVLMEV